LPVLRARPYGIQSAGGVRERAGGGSVSDAFFCVGR
jgi:hypothetical protein